MEPFYLYRPWWLHDAADKIRIVYCERVLSVQGLCILRYLYCSFKAGSLFSSVSSDRNRFKAAFWESSKFFTVSLKEKRLYVCHRLLLWSRKWFSAACSSAVRGGLLMPSSIFQKFSNSNCKLNVWCICNSRLLLLGTIPPMTQPNCVFWSIRSKLVADGSLICPMLRKDGDGPDPMSICIGAALLKSGSANLMFGGMAINSRSIVLFGTNAETECIECMKKLSFCKIGVIGLDFCNYVLVACSM